MRAAPTSFPRVSPFGLAAILAVALVGSACKKDEPAGPQGTPPPPPAVAAGSAGGPATPSQCTADKVGISDPKVAQVLPAEVAGFCLTKTSAIRSWGEGTGKKIDDVSDIIDGAGEIYASNYFAKRYDSLKYVEDKGPAEIEVALTTYDKPENAYALFAYRAVANADPDPEVAKKQGRTPMRAIEGGGAAALGNGSALLWKGNFLAELTYSPDPSASAAEATAAADAVLPKVVKAIADKIMGGTDLPADVKLLPTEAEGRLPLGIDYVPAKFKRPEGKSDALHVNAGSYATAYMKEGDKRYRVLAFSRDDVGAARDAYQAFAKLPGALPLKDAKDFSDEATHFAFPVGQGGAGAAGKAEGVAARRGTRVIAVIDEELALGDPQQKDGYPRLTKDEKIAKLKTFLAKTGETK